MKHIKLVVCLFPLYLSAQTEPVKPATPETPTKEATEAALRERVKSFYDLQVEGKFRQTEAFVCPESQDAYYARPKAKLFSAEIGSVKLADDLTSATVSELVEQSQSLGGVEKKLRMPAVSHWRHVGGAWCYDVPAASDFADTPFGKMDFRSGKGSAPGATPMSGAPEVKPQNMGAAAKLVDFSKRGVRLPFNADGSDEIVVTNGLPGPVGLRVSCPDVPGLACRFDEAALRAGGQTRLRIDFKFKETPIKAGQAVRIWIDPFGRLVSIPISKLEPSKP
jgi:hypothetical protein